jgi:hypothetical protein
MSVLNLFKKPKPELLFSATTPKKKWEKEFIGKTVVIDGKKHEIRTIVGNRWKPQFYEINGKHCIGMLRFHAQMMGVKDISEEQFKQFEEMDMEADREQKKPNAFGLTPSGDDCA